MDTMTSLRWHRICLRRSRMPWRMAGMRMLTRRRRVMQAKPQRQLRRPLCLHQRPRKPKRALVGVGRVKQQRHLQRFPPQPQLPRIKAIQCTEQLLTCKRINMLSCNHMATKWGNPRGQRMAIRLRMLITRKKPPRLLQLLLIMPNSNKASSRIRTLKRR